MSKLKILKDLPLFAGLAREHLSELELASQRENFQGGQAIYGVGDSARAMYVLLAGQVKLALACNRGNEKVIDVLDAGRSFGEAELFGGRPYLAGAAAVKPTQLLCIAGEQVRRVMEQDARVAPRIVTLLANRQFELEAELAASHFCSAGNRLLGFFLSLAGANRDQAEETLVSLNISKRLLASRFDMKPETLSRTLRDLTEAGLIAVDGCQVRLKNARIARYLAEESTAQSIILPERLRAAHARGNGYAEISEAARAVTPEAGLRPSCAAINQAARHRMLSQRMAKSWLMIERGVFSRRARLILKQSMDMFDRELRGLDSVVACAESRAARGELDRLWPPYRALLASEPGAKAARKLFGISEEVLAAAQSLTVSMEKADGTRQGELVNLAGRKRMLSQRAAKLFVFQHMGIQAAKCRTELEAANAEFSTALQELASATQDQPRLATELRSVAGHWNAMRSAMAIRDGDAFSAQARRVFATSENLLRRTDAAVEMCVRLPG